MRIVLDTNVLISATFWTGASFRILQLIEQGKATLVLSKQILDEYDRIVHSDEILQKQAFQQERKDAVLKILQLAVLVEPKEHITAVKDDPDDNKFIEAAIAANATYIISQDKKHLISLKEFRGIKIVTPETFLSLLEK